MDFTDDELERYSRQIILREVGGVGQAQLKAANVLVVGAGGLGAPILMYLAGAGVGCITVIDSDLVELSNLHRQTLYSIDDIGAPKAVAAATLLGNLNPEIEVTGIADRLVPDNVDRIVSGYDVVVDGCDNFTTRLLVSDACVRAKTTLISGAIAAYEGQISVFKPHEGSDLPCYRCFMPDHPGESAERTCSDIGVLGPVAGTVACMTAFEVLREIIGIQGGLVSKIKLVDMLGGIDRTVKLQKNPGCSACSSLAKGGLTSGGHRETR